MKKKYFYRTFLLLLLAGIVDGCNESEGNDAGSPKNSFAEEAHAWYEGYKSDPIHLKLTADVPDLMVIPEWSYGRINQNDDYMTYEVPIMAEQYFRIIDPECQAKYEETGDSRYLLSGAHLVIRKNLSTNEVDGFLMANSPSLAYLESTHFKPFRYMGYLERDQSYSGFISYYNLDGQFVNGWQYRDEIAYAVSDGGGVSPEEVNLRSGCQNVYYEYVVTTCYSHYTDIGGYVFPLQLDGCTEEYGWAYAYTICDYSGGSGDYGNSGGSPSSGDGDGFANSIISSIAPTNSLDATGLERLRSIIEDMEQNCVYSYMLNFVLNDPQYRFTDIKYDPNISSGNYNPTTGVYSVKNSDNIFFSFPEEFIHMYQNRRYLGGISQYTETGKPNIEFEAKLLQDIACEMLYGICSFLGAGNSLSSDYYDWVMRLTDYGACAPSYEQILNYKYNGHGYWDFMESFKVKDPAYDKPINYNLAPVLLRDVSYYFKCN